MIEIDGKIYRNLEEQVRKNKEDIESIDTNVTSNTNAIGTKANQSDLNATNTRVTTLETTVTELTPEVAKSLKTPMTAPTSTELVAVDTANGQAMISIGAGLVIENDTLKSTGGVQIVDNLTSTNISAALSANQGRVLNSMISTKANQSALDSTNANVTSNTNAIAGINDRLDNLDLTYATDEDVQNLQSQINTKASQNALDTTNANVTSNSNQIGTLAAETAQNTQNISNKANANADNINNDDWLIKLKSAKFQTVWNGSLASGNSLSINLNNYDYVMFIGINDAAAIMKINTSRDTYCSIAVSNVSSGTEYRDILRIKYLPGSMSLQVWGYENNSAVSSFSMNTIVGVNLYD